MQHTCKHLHAREQWMVCTRTDHVPGSLCVRARPSHAQPKQARQACKQRVGLRKQASGLTMTAGRNFGACCYTCLAGMQTDERLPSLTADLLLRNNARTAPTRVASTHPSRTRTHIADHTAGWHTPWVPRARFRMCTRAAPTHHEARERGGGGQPQHATHQCSETCAEHHSALVGALSSARARPAHGACARLLDAVQRQPLPVSPARNRKAYERLVLVHSLRCVCGGATRCWG
jgi:hypothetical protein